MRAALVTGGSGGIGLALARALAQEGYALTLAARGREGLERAAQELRRGGARVEHVAVDLAQEAGVRAAVAAHREAHGRLDVLVNNAGTGSGQALAEITTKRLDLQLGLNLRSAVLMYRECAPLLRNAGAEHRRAWVVNTASRAAVFPQPWLSAYSASKSGLVAFSQAMNLELADEGVRSCAVCPGTVRTALSSYLDDVVEGPGGRPAGARVAEQTRAAPDAAAEMLDAQDVAEVLRMLLRLSPACVVNQIVLEGPADRLWRPPA